MNPCPIKLVVIALTASVIASCGSSDITEYTDTYQIKACGDLSESIENVEASLEGNYQLAHAMAARTVEHDCVNELDQIAQTGFDLNYVQGSQTILDIAKFKQQNKPVLIIGYLESKGVTSPYFDKRDAENKAREAKAKAKKNERERNVKERADKKAKAAEAREAKKAEREERIVKKNAEIHAKRAIQAEERRLSKLPLCDQLDEKLLKDMLTPEEAFNQAVVDNCPNSLPMVIGLLSSQGKTSLPDVTYKKWTGDATGFSIRSKRPELAKALINNELFDKKKAVKVLDSYVMGGASSYLKPEKIEALKEYIKLGYLDFDPEYTTSFVQKAYLGGNSSIIKILSEAYFKPTAKGEEFGFKNYRLGADYAMYDGTLGVNCPETAVDGYYICTTGKNNSNSSSIFGVDIERFDLTFIENRLARIRMYIERSSQYAEKAAEDKNFQAIVKGFNGAYGKDTNKAADIADWKNSLQQEITIAHDVHVGTVKASGVMRSYNIIKDKKWRVNVLRIEDNPLMGKLTAITKTLQDEQALAEKKAVADQLAIDIGKAGEKGNLSKFNGLELGKPIPSGWAASVIRCNDDKQKGNRVAIKAVDVVKPRAKVCRITKPAAPNKMLGKKMKVDYVRVLTLDGLLTQAAFVFDYSRYDHVGDGLKILKTLHDEGSPLVKEKYDQQSWYYKKTTKAKHASENWTPTYWKKGDVEAVYGWLNPATRDGSEFKKSAVKPAFIMVDINKYSEGVSIYQNEAAEREAKRIKEIEDKRNVAKLKIEQEKARKAADF